MPSAIAHRLERLFTHRLAAPLCLLAALGARLLQLVFFYNLRWDASFQVLAMQNLVRGKGITITRVLATDLSHPIYEPLVSWPPGYSLLLAPFYLAFDKNYIAAALTLDIAAAFLLIFTARRLLRLLCAAPSLQNAATLVLGFFLYAFYFIASSDAIAIALYLLAVCLTLVLLKNGKPDVWRSLLLCALLLLTGWIKYLFFPLALLLPLYLVLKGGMQKNRALRNAGVLFCLVIAAGLGALLLYQKAVSGTAAYVSAPGRGFFPRHLLDAYPFLPAALVKPDTVTRFLSPAAGQLFYHVLQIVHVLAFATLVLVAAGALRRKHMIRFSLRDDFYFLSLAAAGCLSLLLALLSLRVEKEQILPGLFWTYVEEARYYGLATVLVQLSLFVFRQQARETASPRGLWLTGLLFLLMIPELVRGAIFTVNRLRLLGREEYSWHYEYRFQKFADTVLHREEIRSGAKHAVVTGPVHFLNNRIAIYDGIALLESDRVLNEPEQLHAREKTLLLVVLPDREAIHYSSFLSRKDLQLAGRFDDLTLYACYVDQP